MFDIDRLYKKFDKVFNTYYNLEYNTLVNFSKHKDLPFQRWHYYQEGYSPYILEKLLSHHNVNFKNITILDPFSGSGSTMVGAQNLGIDGIGIELNPFSYFMSIVKTTDFKIEDIEIAKQFQTPDFEEIDDLYGKYELSMIERLYSKENLTKIELIKRSINEIKNDDSKKILLAALYSIFEETSNYKKGGNGLKKRKKIEYFDLFEKFNEKKRCIIEDLILKLSTSKITLYNENVNNIDDIIKNDSIDFTLFSPPYVNCFDYFEVYKIELWLGEFITSYKELKEIRKSALTSNLNVDLNKEIIKEDLSPNLLSVINEIDESLLFDKRIKKMIYLYFIEMKQLLISLFQKSKKGALVNIVVGNSAYGGVPIATDIFLAEIGEEIGFNVKEIIVARNNETSSQQYKKIGELVKYIRESIVVLEK